MFRRFSRFARLRYYVLDTNHLYTYVRGVLVVVKNPEDILGRRGYLARVHAEQTRTTVVFRVLESVV